MSLLEQSSLMASLYTPQSNQLLQLLYFQSSGLFPCEWHLWLTNILLCLSAPTLDKLKPNLGGLWTEILWLKIEDQIFLIDIFLQIMACKLTNLSDFTADKKLSCSEKFGKPWQNLVDLKITRSIKDASSYQLFKQNLDKPPRYWTNSNSKKRPVW